MMTTRASLYLSEMFTGIADDGNSQYVNHPTPLETTYPPKLGPNRINAVAFTNGYATQTAQTRVHEMLDGLGVRFFVAPYGELYPAWWGNSTTLPTLACTPANALALAAPIVEKLYEYPNFIGYLLRDDMPISVRRFQNGVWGPDEPQSERAHTLIEAFNQLDPLHCAMPVNVGPPHLAVFDNCPTQRAMFTYCYPMLQSTAEGVFNNYSGRLRTLFSPALARGVPIFLDIQANMTDFGPVGTRLRYPTVDEMRVLFWEAIGEGAHGVFWFTGCDVPSQGWQGLFTFSDKTARARDLYARLLPRIRKRLVKTVRNPIDQFVASGLYVSTLTHEDGSHYFVIVNETTTSKTVALTSPTGLTGNVRRLDFDAFVVNEPVINPTAIGATITMGALDGGMWKHEP